MQVDAKFKIKTNINSIMKTVKRAPLCPSCYEEMTAKYNSEKKFLYYECPKCGNRIIVSHAGH
jgi:predicted RNA-binding Zn-ribbon protein involved in translation (DUF1610 family)